VERIGREIELRAVVRRQREVAEVERLVAEVRQICDPDDVSRALRHLGVVHGQELAVHPDGHDAMAEGALRLGDLVLVVRELEVDPAGVDVEALAEVLERHGGALDVPSRKAVAPG
jgi:hypothetical protein